MQIPLTLPDPEYFNFKDCFVAGDECFLITPKDMSTKWDDTNFRFRSCLIRKSDNFVISQGFGKFTNFGERPDFQPWDANCKFQARHKLDGSLLIVSKYKGELIIRTRGTIDARQMENGHEIDLLMQKYPDVFNFSFLSEDVSILLEWTTPNNIIVLREHDEPTLTLVGLVRNSDCSYIEQKWLDEIAGVMGVNRPREYIYSSVAECVADVSAWEGKEGVVLYSQDGQTLKKIKSDIYCELHKLASGMTSVSQVLDVFMASPKFTYWKDFFTYVETTLDYEIAERCKNHIIEIAGAYNRVDIYEGKLKHFIDHDIKFLPTRKDQALKIQAEIDIPWMQAYCFSLLNGKEIDEKLIRKAIESELNV